nr:avidin-like [Pelodiscus sinensis]|eukprot:XP_014429448.2 avidin-like [Pelodiscus sinensis]
MWIGNVEADGSFSGEYQTAVSSTEKPIKLARLNGSQNKASTEQPTFGFTVNWDSFSDSTTVFTGQCFMDEDKQESLQTMWLLREKAEFATDNWKATTVGTNVFTRVK